MVPASLFDAASSLGEHRAAFERWLADQSSSGVLRQSSSMAVYEDMWGSFTAWCLAQSPVVTLASLDVRDLAAFQQARFGVKSPDMSLSPRHARRLLRLIERVLAHHAAATGSPLNTAATDWIAAQPAVRHADAAEADPPPEFLSVSEARHLVVFLSEARPRPAARGSRAPRRVALSWQRLRNRAAVALQLGAGLTPREVRGLTVAGVTSQGGRSEGRPWKVAVAGSGEAPAREAPVAPWAGELLRYWLRVRGEERIAGEWLFASTRTGKPWSKEAQYLAARQVFEEAGLDAAEGGSFRLRHTFALRQLRRGTAPEEVARWLGVEVGEMEKYLRVLGQQEGL